MNEQMKEITDKLKQGIYEVFESERFKNYLNVMSKFHNYSFNNTMLIAMQNPNATLVAGYQSWKKFGRHVIKGSKGIKVIAPAPYKIKKEMEKIDPNTKKPVIGKDGNPIMQEMDITIPAFKVVSVFDVSQTEGKELPSIVNELSGDVDKYAELFNILEQISPVPVEFEKIEKNGAYGYYHSGDKRIALNEGMGELQNLKTLIHEIAHAKLHDTEEQKINVPDRRTCEVQAESVAYTVCQYLGLDTSDYSFSYVAGWSSGKELPELKKSLETIRQTASDIITKIEDKRKELPLKMQTGTRTSIMDKLSANKSIIEQEEGNKKITERSTQERG